MAQKLVPQKSFFSKVAGVSHQNPDGSKRQRIISQCRVGERLLLEREPDNEYDENAIAVYRSRSHEQIGYVTSHVAEKYAPEMSDGTHLEAVISDLTGEGERLRGVNIEITLYGVVERPSMLGALFRTLAIAWKRFVWSPCDALLRRFAGDNNALYKLCKALLIATMIIAALLVVWLMA